MLIKYSIFITGKLHGQLHGLKHHFYFVKRFLSCFSLQSATDSSDLPHQSFFRLRRAAFHSWNESGPKAPCPVQPASQKVCRFHKLDRIMWSVRSLDDWGRLKVNSATAPVFDGNLWREKRVSPVLTQRDLRPIMCDPGVDPNAPDSGLPGPRTWGWRWRAGINRPVWVMTARHVCGVKLINGHQ